MYLLRQVCQTKQVFILPGHAVGWARWFTKASIDQLLHFCAFLSSDCGSDWKAPGRRLSTV